MSNIIVQKVKSRLIVLASAFLLVQCTVPNNDLAEGFTDPPGSYRAGAFWCWLNGNQTKENISRDLREMSEKGMGRAEIWDVAAINNPDNYIPAGPQFLSDSSISMIKYAFDEGRKYGIKLGMVGSSGWNAGGTWVEPEWASKQLYYSQVVIKGPVKNNIELPFPEVPARCPKDENGEPQYYREVAVLAMPYSDEKNIGSSKDIIDFSDKLSDGKISVDLPVGEWIIMRFICSNNGQMLIVPSPKSNGLFIDFLDPESTKKHLSQFMTNLGIPKGEERDGGLAYLEFDSMELAEGIAWTDSMPSIFKRMRGYDIRSYLPVLAGWSIKDESERFLYDWKKTVSDQLIFSHYTTGRKFLEEYGVDLVAEAGGPGPPTWSTCPVDALKALGNVSVPRGEFWVRHRDIFLIKEVASAGHIYGRNVIDAESFTTWRRWKDSPYDLKKLVDRAFCEGLNCVTFHTFASTGPEDGLPGRTYHAGSDINHANTWWEKSGPFMDYLARCSYMLQQGLFVADVAYYYGDQAPNFWPSYHVVPEKIIPKGLGEGYDYDVVNSDVILNRMKMNNYNLTLPDGLSYSVLVLPDQDHIPIDVLRKIEDMVMLGATIIGRKPTTVPYLNNYEEENRELERIVEDMWGDIDGKDVKYNNYGSGRVISGLTAREVLSHLSLAPDFIHENSSLDYIHRRNSETDIYFIRNKSGQAYSGECSFRISNKYPELWDPSTGDCYKPLEYSEENNRISMHLDLEPGSSIFVVFNSKKRSLPEIPKNYTREEKTTVITGSWKLSFPEGWGAPAQASFDSLVSWTDSNNDGIRYFSGTASYHKTISIEKNDINKSARIEIDLGKVADVAEVFLNGKSAGILWKEPFRVDITDLLTSGDNELKIEVVNQWVNRLTGDMLLDPENRFCRTNQPYITADDMGNDNWVGNSDETYHLQKSGLLGPVRLLFVKPATRNP